MRVKILSLVRRLAIAVAMAVAILAITIAALLVFKPTLNLTAFKSVFEAPLTAFMERPITVDGVWLRPGSWTRIRLTGLSIEAAGNDPDGVFAHAPEVELELAVVPLLKSQIRLRALTARGFDFDIRQFADGTGNWPVWTTFTY
ncbi:MAG: AsmA family protein, partial [Acidobacteria bacterium]|nr:AsmA family protein [Candidatus Sulfomarinibacter kjeldsenii]